MSIQMQSGDFQSPSPQMECSATRPSSDDIRDAMLEERRKTDMRKIAGIIQKGRNQSALENVRWFSENQKKFA